MSFSNCCQVIEDLIHDLALPYSNKKEPQWLTGFKKKFIDIKSSNQRVNPQKTGQLTQVQLTQEKQKTATSGKTTSNKNNLSMGRKLTLDKPVKIYGEPETGLSQVAGSSSKSAVNDIDDKSLDMAGRIKLFNALNELRESPVGDYNQLIIYKIRHEIVSDVAIYQSLRSEKDALDLIGIKDALFADVNNYLKKKNISKDRRMVMENLASTLNLLVSDEYRRAQYRLEKQAETYAIYAKLYFVIGEAYRHIIHDDHGKIRNISGSRAITVLEKYSGKIQKKCDESIEVARCITQFNNNDGTRFLQVFDSLILAIDDYLAPGLLKKQPGSDRAELFKSLKSEIEEVLNPEFRKRILEQLVPTEEVGSTAATLLKKINAGFVTIKVKDKGKYRNFTGSRAKKILNHYQHTIFRELDINRVKSAEQPGVIKPIDQECDNNQCFLSLNVQLGNASRHRFWNNDRIITSVHKKQLTAGLETLSVDKDLAKLFELLLNLRAMELEADKHLYWFQTGYTATNLGKNIDRAIRVIVNRAEHDPELKEKITPLCERYMTNLSLSSGNLARTWTVINPTFGLPAGPTTLSKYDNTEYSVNSKHEGVNINDMLNPVASVKIESIPTKLRNDKMKK